MSRLIRIVFPIALAWLVACAAPPETFERWDDSGAVAFDFVASFDPRSATGEVGEIDFGTPAARTHLRDGWSFDEKRDDRTWVWGQDRSSSLDVFIFEAQTIPLEFRCRPLVQAGLPAQQVTIIVNDRRVAEVTLKSGWREYRVDAPAEFWRSGRNRIRFDYRFNRSSADVGGNSKDMRRLAVSWDWLRLVGLHEPAGAQPLAQDGVLLLPLSTQVDYYVDVPAGARLVVDPPETWASGGSMPDYRAEVLIHSAQESHPRAFEIGARGIRLPLDDLAGESARISFRATHKASWFSGWIEFLGWIASPRKSGIALPRPVIRVDPPPSQDEHPVSVPQRVRSRPNVLVYLVDTLRADHLGCYGYDRPTSPNIDRFAADAIRFERTFAQSSWTRASVASLFTGLYPQTHQVTGRSHSLPEEANTLPEMLRELGYETAGFVTNPNITWGYGFGQGFDRYISLPQTSSRDILRLSDDINDLAFDWLEKRQDKTRPFLLYLHSTDPHAPYTPREPWLSRFAANADSELGEIESIKRISAGNMRVGESERQSLIDLYDAEIGFNDATFGALIEKLRELELYDSTLIILVSDHGEEFFDHGGWQHGSTLYEEQLHVPFLLRLPNGEAAGQSVDALAQLVDVLPTILDGLGEPASKELDGKSLLPAVVGGTLSEHVGIAHLDLDGHRLEAVVDGNQKLIRWLPVRPYSRVELYDLDNDPEEEEDLSSKQEIGLGVLQRQLDEFSAMRVPMSREEAEIPPEVEERLRALGYLQ